MSRSPSEHMGVSSVSSTTSPTHSPDDSSSPATIMSWGLKTAASSPSAASAPVVVGQPKDNVKDDVQKTKK
eukprot:4800420-Pyramimonas_sp.AAC.1